MTLASTQAEKPLGSEMSGVMSPREDDTGLRIVGNVDDRGSRIGTASLLSVMVAPTFLLLLANLT